MSLIFGMDSTKTQRPILCNTDGSLELTAELDTSGLNKEATQLLVKANTEVGHGAGNNTRGNIGDGSTQQNVVCLGYDQPNGKMVSLNVNSGGNLAVDVQSGVAIATIGSGGHGSGVGVISCGLDSGDNARALLTDGTGKLQVDVVDTANVKFEDIRSSLNSGTNNDPANSLAVGLRARQTITDASTETFLKCSASGVLEVSSSGGGGSASNQYNNGGTEETLSVVAPTAPATGNITPAVTILDLQNYKGVAFNVTTTSAGYTALTMGVEFSNVNNFASTLGIGYNDIQIFDIPTDVGGNPITGQYQSTILMIPEHNSQQPLGRYARVTFNHSNNAGSNVSVVINSTQIPH